MSQVILFGAGKTAEVAYHYLTHDSPHEIAAFTVDGQYVTGGQFLGLPLVPFEELPEKYPPDDFDMLVAVGYRELNKLRASKCAAAKRLGYRLISYVSSRASNVAGVAVGENCFILENQSIQPCVTIGHDVTIWSGNHIGHHSAIGDHCFITSHVVISGITTVEPYCFIGVNATIGHGLTIGQESILGAGCVVTKNVKPKSVFIAQDTPLYRLDSRRFMRFSRLVEGGAS